MAHEHEGYDSGHPWYYKLGGRILDVAEIELPRDLSHYSIPNTPEKIETMLQSVRKGMENDIARYLDLKGRGMEALSDYERRDFLTNEKMPYYVAISLKHNHICYGKGHAHVLETELKKFSMQLSLF